MITPGVCLTYDDLYIDNWLAVRPILNAYGAKVTFCVCMIHKLTPAQIDGLRILQDDGHEIGFHGRNHLRLKPYLRKHGLKAWFENEIERGVKEHHALGFPATSYAAPFYGSTPRSRAATAPYIKITRANSARHVADFDVLPRIYQRPLPDGAVHSIGSLDFQNPSAGEWAPLAAKLDLLIEHQGVGIFNGHDIRPQQSDPGRYSTHRQLDRLLGAIRDRGLAFHTLSGFAHST